MNPWILGGKRENPAASESFSKRFGPMFRRARWIGEIERHSFNGQIISVEMPYPKLNNEDFVGIVVLRSCEHHGHRFVSPTAMGSGKPFRNWAEALTYTTMIPTNPGGGVGSLTACFGTPRTLEECSSRMISRATSPSVSLWKKSRPDLPLPSMKASTSALSGKLQ